MTEPKNDAARRQLIDSLASLKRRLKYLQRQQGVEKEIAACRKAIDQLTEMLALFHD
jgi:hypothetical protein